MVNDDWDDKCDDKLALVMLVLTVCIPTVNVGGVCDNGVVCGYVDDINDCVCDCDVVYGDGVCAVLVTMVWVVLVNIMMVIMMIMAILNMNDVDSGGDVDSGVGVGVYDNDGCGAEFENCDNEDKDYVHDRGDNDDMNGCEHNDNGVGDGKYDKK